MTRADNPSLATVTIGLGRRGIPQLGLTSYVRRPRVVPNSGLARQVTLAEPNTLLYNALPSSCDIVPSSILNSASSA
jgi:hypothetical protein